MLPCLDSTAVIVHFYKPLTPSPHAPAPITSVRNIENMNWASWAFESRFVILSMHELLLLFWWLRRRGLGLSDKHEEREWHGGAGETIGQNLFQGR